MKHACYLSFNDKILNILLFCLELLGKYQEERAGLCNTPNYDPYKLQSVMNAEERRGGAVFDITDSHKDVLNLQTELNHDMAQVVLCSGGSMISQVGRANPRGWVLAYYLA